MSNLDASNAWTQQQVINLCRVLEDVVPQFGCHVALTGGCLYKDGLRKDADIMFYRIRQVEKIDEEGLFKTLKQMGIEKVSGFGWCHKATFMGKNIDFFFPEEDGEYPETT